MTWAASSASAVLPRPGSSASRKVRCPWAAAATTCAWCAMSGRGYLVRSAAGAGNVMQDTAPPAAFSNDRSSGPSSSQFASSRGRATGGGGAEKSGARNGLASFLEMTDRGTTCRSALGEAAAAGSGAMSAAGGSRPAARRSSRSTARVPWSSSASSISRASSDPSRAAARARIVAMPSRRRSCSARRDSPVPTDWIRSRSSRTSSATAWNVMRVVGRTRPRWTATSMSRTALASTGNMASSGRPRVAGCWDAGARDGRRARVATQLPSDLFAPRAGRPPMTARHARHPRGPRPRGPDHTWPVQSGLNAHTASRLGTRSDGRRCDRAGRRRQAWRSSPSVPLPYEPCGGQTGCAPEQYPGP